MLERIASNNGITVSAQLDLDTSDGYVIADGIRYELGSYHSTTTNTYTHTGFSNMGSGIRWDTGSSIYSGTGTSSSKILIKSSLCLIFIF